jgi:hypothetical protein
MKQMYSGEKLNKMCNRIKQFACQYYKGVGLDKGGMRPLEIEELWKLGKSNTHCPYYQQQANYAEADIVFIPYNFLMNL